MDESNPAIIDITQYNILDRNYTQVGNGCSTPNCTSWTQGVWPLITSDWVITNGGVPQNGNLRFF